MHGDTLGELLERNRKHVDSLDAAHFDAVQDGQEPAVVSICCADSRVDQTGMFRAEEAGYIFTPSNIGNRAYVTVDGEDAISGDLLYAPVHAGTRAIVVVGHTGCGAITAAYRAVTGDLDPTDEPLAIRHALEQDLIPVVEAGLASDTVDTDADDETVINQLVEYNVDHQVASLNGHDDVPSDAAVYGVVYDFQDVYGERGRTVLINADGETDVELLREAVPREHADAVQRLTGR